MPDMKSGSAIFSGRLAAWFSLAGLLTFCGPAQADPTLLTIVPADGAFGVPTTTTIVFTFSEEMDPDATSAMFYIISPFTFLTTADSWNAGHTVLTCTPTAPLPENTIYWVVSGANPNGDPVDGFGSFTARTGGSTGGSGTNAITSFTLGKLHFYTQTSVAAPTLDPDFPYYFSADTSLSSNRTATNITLKLPTTIITNLTQDFFEPETYSLFAFDTNLTRLDNNFPSGDYIFTVKAVNSNQTVTVNLPATMAQPDAPHLANYAAAQAVNPAADFALHWDAFPGGIASDYIHVDVGDEFSSADPYEPGALSGTATTVTIPAGTLQANSSYDGAITFYRFVSMTNGNSYVTLAYRATITDFTLLTTGSSGSSPLVLTNAIFTPANFSFDVLCAVGQSVTVEYRTNLATGSWQTLMTTNSPGTSFRVVAPQSTTNPSLFFRARNGP